jgi:hypothetical protein
LLMLSALTKRRHGFSITYATNLPISLTLVLLTRLGLLGQQHLYWF